MTPSHLMKKKVQSTETFVESVSNKKVGAAHRNICRYLEALGRTTTVGVAQSHADGFRFNLLEFTQFLQNKKNI